MTEQIQQISLDLIDDPNAPMRTSMDDEKLSELSRSISTQGLIQPITLRRVGERYEVVAGHRRFKASRLAGLVYVSAIVRQLDEAGTDAMRMHENLYREDINPVDEGRYIRKMIDEHDYDVEDLCTMTGKSEAYLRARYNLIEYPDYLLQAVEQERVSLSAAQWLFKIRDDNRRKEYTRFAIIGGLTAKRAEAWFRSWELGSLPPEATAFVPAEGEENVEPIPLLMPCIICRREDDLENLSMQYAHMDCTRAVADSIKKKLNDEESEPF
ncbi:MAG: ParB/RepB/Spo0J family partition protein [Nitrososphaera sp.]|nr:ParB/RepB/Spo0J family partition protein [Nitrososphaera sp.]